METVESAEKRRAATTNAIGTSDAQDDDPKDDNEAYTVSKMLAGFNAVMAPVAVDPSASVSLKRRASNGVMLDTSPKEIAYLDTCAKVKHSAQRVAPLSRAEKAQWTDAHRARGNAAFLRGEYASAADLYVQALAALDFGSTNVDRERCQLDAQLPLTCNLAACMLMLEQWTKARHMCDEALKVQPTYVKALRQRARASMRLHEFTRAKDDVRAAIIAATAAASDADDTAVTTVRLQLERQLLDIDRAELRHKQQLQQQKRFHTNMMREGVGRLYCDKQAPAASSSARSPIRSSAPPQSSSSSSSSSLVLSGVTQTLAWTRAALASLLQRAMHTITASLRQLQRQLQATATSNDNNTDANDMKRM